MLGLENLSIYCLQSVHSFTQGLVDDLGPLVLIIQLSFFPLLLVGVLHRTLVLVCISVYKELSIIIL